MLLEKFDKSSETFDIYCQRLENVFKLKGLNQNSKESENIICKFIYYLGSNYYKLFASLTAPMT